VSNSNSNSQSKKGGLKQEVTSEQPAQNENIAMRRAKPHKPTILNFLEEIGYEDIFNSNEISDIKEMFNKNQNNVTKNELLLDSIHKFDADIEYKIKENAEEAHSQNGSNGGNEEQVSEASARNLTTKIFKRLNNMQTYNLKSHLDAARDGKFIAHLGQAVTVSEDCTIKLWDLRNMGEEDKQLTEDIKYNFIDDGSDYAGDPKSFYSYYTLKSHTGIVTKLSVDMRSADDSSLDTMFYTAGIEGIVRAWKIPDPDNVKQFGKDADLTSKL
jgi:WD40 repeat protein